MLIQEAFSSYLIRATTVIPKNTSCLVGVCGGRAVTKILFYKFAGNFLSDTFLRFHGNFISGHCIVKMPKTIYELTPLHLRLDLKAHFN